MEIKLEEIEWFGLVSMVLGAFLFIAICCWDGFASGRVAYNKGYGYMQILAMGASGLYTLWAYCIHLKWKEYRKMIHKMGA